MSLKAVQGVQVLERLGRDDVVCLCCNRGEHQYDILANGRAILVAREHKDMCCQDCGCFCKRDFDVSIEDEKNNKLYTVTKKTLCCAICPVFPCCRHRLSLEDAKGTLVGSASNDCRLCCTCFPKFSGYNAADETVFNVAKDVNCCAGLCGNCKCCCFQFTIPIEYDVQSPAGRGRITERDSGAEVNNYTVEFPANATEEQRLLLVSTCFLLDYFDAAKPPPKQKM